MALAQLWPMIAPRLSLDHALHRGRYMKAVTRMEWSGTPVDADLLAEITSRWEDLKLELISRVDAGFGVFDGTTFKRDRWLAWCEKRSIAWPRLVSNRPALDKDTFKRMAKIYPEIEPMRQLLSTLGALRLSDLPVGKDGRNRCMLSPFRSITGRNQPGSSSFIFGQPAWLRSLIKPAEGGAIAYIDYSQQEFGIVAALSGDAVMQAAYRSGDPYLYFAKMANAVPAEATKRSHPRERERFKTCALAVQYGQGAESLGLAVGGSAADGAHLIAQHKSVFSTYWAWMGRVEQHAHLHLKLHTVFGFEMHETETTKWRTTTNFPGQGNGAEMLRLACIQATEQGICVCAPVHDALLIEAPASEIDQAIARTKDAMAWASRVVLGGFELLSDAKVVKWPDRYVDGRGKELWDVMADFLNGRRRRDHCQVG